MVYKFILFFSILFSVGHLTARNPMEEIVKNLKLHTTKAEVLHFNNLKQNTIPSKELPKIYSIIHKDLITPSSNDYEVAKINFIANKNQLLEVLIYYNMQDDVFYTSFQVDQNTYYSRLNDKIVAVLNLSK